MRLNRGVSVLVAVAAFGLAPTASADVSVGFAVELLPMPVGGPLSGYGSLRERTADGVLDPTEARALVFEDADTSAAIVALDVLIVRPRLREATLRALGDWRPDPLILTATHTHSGPGGYEPGWVAARVTGAAFREEAPDAIGSAIARALTTARARLKPARASAGLARSAVPENRRFDDGPAETALPLLRFEFGDASPAVVLFALGAHPIVLSNRTHQYSADYIGAARERLGAAGLESVFVAGPLGDQRPRSELGPLWPDEIELQREQAREIGERLAGEVLAGLASLPAAAPASLRGVERYVATPKPRFRRYCAFWWFSPLIRGALTSFLSEQVRFSALQVGPALLMAMPAEPASAVGDRLRAVAGPATVPFVIAHAHDWVGYAVSAETYARGGYESCMSFFGPEIADWLVNEVEHTTSDLEPRAAGRSAAR